MEYNPLEPHLESLIAKIGTLHKQHQLLEDDLGWSASFDRGKAERNLFENAALEQVYAREHDLVSTALSREKRRLRSLEEVARPGWNPTHWFSSERSTAKSSLSKTQASVAQLESQRDRLANKVETVKEETRKLEGDVERFDHFNPLICKNTLASVDTKLAILELEVDQVEARKREVDRQLSPLLAELGRVQAEAESIDHTLRLARKFDREITQAPNSYERAMVHQKCQDKLGDSSPRRVIKTRERQLEAVQRDIHKLESRLRHIAEVASRTVEALIIDGSNLCYEDSRFIGLTALKALCREVIKDRDVTVVFDASIRQKLRIGEDQIRLELPTVKVHVVASRRKADETILHLAADDYVYILSNDRYIEYPEAPAVTKNRIIRHEIVNGRVLVHDLYIDEMFDLGC